MSDSATRREAMKKVLKTGAYAAPVILSATIPPAVSAQVTPPPPVLTSTPPVAPLGTTITIRDTGFAPNTFYRVHITRPPTSTVPPVLGLVRSDATGAFSFTFTVSAASGSQEAGMYTIGVSRTPTSPILATTTFTYT